MTQPENVDVGFCPESFRRSWAQAMAGETLPLSILWEDDEDSDKVIPDISNEEQADIEAQFGKPDDDDDTEWGRSDRNVSRSMASRRRSDSSTSNITSSITML